MRGVATSPQVGKESVVGGFQWVEHKTFLEIVPTTDPEVSMAPVRRENSAPPSVSCSSSCSSNSASNSDVDEPMDGTLESTGEDGTGEDGTGEDGTRESQEGSAQGGQRTRQNRRPCKGKRDRYKLYADQCESRITKNPGLKIDSFHFPPWLLENPTLIDKLRARLERHKASVNIDAAAGRPGPAPKRALSPGAVLPRAKRQAGPAEQAQSSTASSSSFEQGLHRQNVPRPPRRQKVVVSL